MNTDKLVHHVDWTTAPLSEKPLNFSKVVFLVGAVGNNERVSTYQKFLMNEGYSTAVVKDANELGTSLTADTIVVHIPDVAGNMDGIYEAVTRSCTNLIAAAQLLYQRIQGGTNTSCKLFSLITKDSDIGELCCSPLYGLARVIKMEIEDDFGGLFEEDQGGFPLAAIKYARGFDVVKVCNGVAQVASLEPFHDEEGDKGQVQLNTESTYLITGGTRGMGLEIASWMGERGARNIILVSRRGLPPVEDGRSKDADVDKLILHISKLEAMGIKVHVLAIDLSKPRTDFLLRQEIDKLHLPPIKGVIHAAGIAGYHTLERCIPSDIASVLAPKVIGALSLDALFPCGTLDFFVLISSVGQLVGFPGQLSYAPANAFLDGLAAYRRRQGDNTTSIQWTSWRGIGLMAQSRSATRMITRGMLARGIADVSEKEAFEALDRIASLNTDHVAVVRALELEANEPLRHPMLKNITPRKPARQRDSSTGPYNSYPNHAVAVVGMACRTAAGDTVDDLWKVIQAGDSMVREIDAQRFPEATRDGKMWGNFLSDIDSFDHQFFKKTKRESSALDPHQRVLLQTTYHALESAGCFGGGQQQKVETHNKTESSCTTGCFIGMNAPDYPLNLACHPPSPYTGFGMLRSFVAGRLSHHFGWTGPSQTIDTACSSAMVAIHQACRAIQVGECTRAIAGGVNLITNTALFDALRVGGFLNETGACKTFDARADGYCRGEAVGIVVLKPLQRALDDGDDIHGVLLATGNNQNINNTSITNPVLESQAALYKDVLARAGVSPGDVSYVEAHGTGTRAGDPIEVQGIRQVLGGKDRCSTLHIGAVKPNIGHSEGASGVISLIKVLLMMKHGKISPQAQFNTLNPNIPALEPDNMAISTSLKEWDDDLRLALVNSYGASGNNAAAVVAPPPPRSPASSLSNTKLAPPALLTSAWPLFISAASKTSLLDYCSKLKHQINHDSFGPSGTSSVAFSLATKQNRQLQHIFCTTTTSLNDLQAQLSDPEKQITSSVGSKPIVLLFSGQNGNAVPPIKPLYESSVLFRTHLHKCGEVMESLGLAPLFPEILQGIQSDSSDLVIRHAAMFAIQYSCGRALIIQNLWGDDTGSMIAIEAELGDTDMTPSKHLGPFHEEHPEARLDIACYNGPNSYVVAGGSQDIELLDSYLQQRKSNGEKLRFKVLRGMHAYHSVMADSIIGESANLSASIPFQNPTFHFESCHEEVWTGPGPNVIARNTRGPVYFTQAISRIVNRLGPCTFLEAGVDGPIVKMARNALPKGQMQNEHSFIGISGKDSVRSLANAVVTLWRNGQPSIQFWPFHRSQQANYTPLPLPPYQFEKSKHWLQYTSLGGGGAGKKASEQTSPRSGLCPHCSKDISDFSYITQDKSRNHGVGKFVFNIDTRSRRYQDIVKGHAVVGSPICPASMYLELASHAIALLSDAQMMNNTSEISVEAFEIKAPLGLDAQRSVKMTLMEKAEGVWGFELSSTKDNDKATSHSTGLVSLRESVSRRHTEQDQKDKWTRITSLLEEDTDTEALRGTMVYKVFGKMAKYSPVYRGLRYLVGKGIEGAGDIIMPSDVLDAMARTPNDNVADPIVMDNFLQVPGAFVHSLRTNGDEDDDSISYICTGMTFVGPLNRLQGSMKYRAYTKIVRENAKEAILDVFAFDRQNGQMVWSAEGLRFTRVPRNSLAKVLAGASSGMDIRQPSKPAAQSPVSKTPYQGTSSPPEKRNEDEKNRTEILSGVQEVLSRSLDVPVEEVTKRASLEELGADSLVSSEILAKISDKFQIQISADEFAAVTDVASFCTLISTHVRCDAAEKSDDSNESQGTDSGFELAKEAVDEWQKTLFEILSHSLDVPVVEIQMDSKLEDLGADSLVAGEITSNINEAFSLDISSVEFTSMVDVVSLCNMIASALGVDSMQTPTASSSDVEPTGSNSRTSGSLTPHTEIISEPAHEKQNSHQVNTRSMHEAFLRIRHGIDAHAKGTKFTGYWDQIYPPQLRTVTAFIIEAFEKLGCSIKEFREGEELPALQRTLGKYHREILRLWEILEEAGIVQKKGNKFLRGPARLGSESKSAKELSTQLILDFPQYSSTHGLPDLLGPHLAECLTGKSDPVPILFGSEKGRSLLEDFYANAPDLRAVTQVLCDFLSAAIRSKSSDGEPFRVLEIGAGTGGTTKYLLPLLQNTGLPFIYTFTELSVSLLSRAKKTTFKGIKGMEFRKLNIEDDPPEELLGSYHMVVSSNCVHATRDLRRSLTNIRKLVRSDDGCVALVELTQKLAWYDLVWGLLDGWWLFDDGRRYALQSPWSWERAMLDAGFAHVDWSESTSRESRSVRVICGLAGDTERPCPAKATSILLHRGVSATGNRNLFLAPDGFGSGAIFVTLKPMLGRARDVSVFALNSPYVKNKPDPHQTPSIQELAGIYVAEIKRRQPEGPYMVGGYSVGGVVAYEVVRQLLEDGDEVEKLLLIDTACPSFVSSMPESLVEFLGSIGRPITNDHFTLARKQLAAYKASRLPGMKLPQAVLVSAREGVDKQDAVRRPEVLPQEQEMVDWFLNDRNDNTWTFGWDRFFGYVDVIRADGNHFSMMSAPMVENWGAAFVKTFSSL